MLYTINGDLVKLTLQGTFDHVIHGCNCFHSMSGGIALQFAKAIPSLVEADKQTPFGDRSKLGKYSFTDITTQRSKAFVYEPQKNQLIMRDLPSGSEDRTTRIYNLYTQYQPGPDLARQSLIKGLVDLAGVIPKDDIIAIPRIGCGIAGGNWETLEVTIRIIFTKHKVILVNYKP